MKSTIQLAHGYTATVETDDMPHNPFEIGDCEPPMAVFNERLAGPCEGISPLTLADLFDRLPEERFTMVESRAAILAAAGIDAGFPELFDGEPDAEAWRWAIREELPEAPGGGSWRYAGEYFDRMEALCGLLGITCYNGISNGYSQGDSVRLFVAATPEWTKLTGCPAEYHADQCKGAADLYGAWAWGDVYGVSAIVRPDGEEVEDADSGGFYGTDHEASGLLEHCREEVTADRSRRLREIREARAFARREKAEAFEAACRDIATA